jgi:hypothetical protein
VFDYSLLAFSIVLLIAVLGLMVWHIVAWRTAQRSNLDPDEIEYRRRQFRRRVQTTAMFGLAIAALPFGLPLARAWPKAGAIYWSVVVLMLLWAAALGLADILAINLFYGRLRDQNRLEQARLKAEIRRIQDARRNGSAAELGKRNGHSTTGPHPGLNDRD